MLENQWKIETKFGLVGLGSKSHDKYSTWNGESAESDTPEIF